MEYSLLDKDSIKHVSFYGNISTASRVKFLEIAKAMPVSEQKEWTLDVSEFDFIDSAGLGMLIELSKTASQHNIQLSITGANDLVLRMLKLTKLETLYQIIE